MHTHQPQSHQKQAGSWLGGILTVLFVVLTGCNQGPTLTTGGGSGPPKATTMSLSASPNPVVVGTPMTLTATMTPSTAEGGFQFTNSAGAVGTVKLATGSASATTTPSQIGTQGYSAQFDGVTGYSPSAGSVNVAVSAAPSASSCGLGTSVYVQTTGNISQANQSYDAAEDNQSAVCVENLGTNLALINPTISKSGNAGIGTDPSGIDSAVLAYGASGTTASGGGITITGGTIHSSGTGAYGVFASGVGASVALTGTSITADSYGVGASAGGNVTLTDSTVVGASTGVGINGNGTVTVTGSSLTGPSSGSFEFFSCRICFYSNLLPGESTQPGSFSMTGGTLNSLDSPVIGLNGAESATITLTNVTIVSGSVFLLSVSTGTTTIVADGVGIAGDFQYQNTQQSAALTLKNKSTFQGQNPGGTMTLDATSSWTLDADTTVGVLNDGVGISGGSVTNIAGNGFNLSYDSANNPSLGGKTYSLVGGGTLMPQ